MVQHMKKNVNITKEKKTLHNHPNQWEKILDTIKHMPTVRMPKKLEVEGNCLN